MIRPDICTASNCCNDGNGHACLSAIGEDKNHILYKLRKYTKLSSPNFKTDLHRMAFRNSSLRLLPNTNNHLGCSSIKYDNFHAIRFQLIDGVREGCSVPLLLPHRF